MKFLYLVLGWVMLAAQAGCTKRAQNSGVPMPERNNYETLQEIANERSWRGSPMQDAARSLLK